MSCVRKDLALDSDADYLYIDSYTLSFLLLGYHLADVAYLLG